MINIENVKKVYSGKPGCMCGCCGIYRSPSTVTLEEISKHKGYAAEPKEINDRQVKKVVRLINWVLEHNSNGENLDINKDYVYVEIDGRAYCAYFTL